ncbi:MAG TPA: hypothetical protein VEB86_07545 [Chryseosolibacter sp.]|nr:hypothetical protein [Chryseosolibacter sp.]
MKKIFLSAIIMIGATTLVAQDFATNLSTARTSYSSGNLDDARLAMQQMMTDLDLAIGKEVLKMLPTTLNTFSANTKNDNVSANSGLAGAIVHRDYGAAEKLLTVDIMSNSPLIGTLNAFLSMPFVGNSSDGSQKTVKVQGYKGVLQKNTDTETNLSSFTLQIPLNNTLLTLTVPDSNEADVLKMANALPVTQIAKMVQ